MGFEVVKGENGKFRLWNTVVDSFEADFGTCKELVDYLDERFQARSNRPMQPEIRDSWMKTCQSAPSEKKFKSGLIRISYEDILKMAEKDNK